MSRYLTITAFWVDDDPDTATEAIVSAVEAVDKEPGTGGCVAIAERDVDRELRAILRSVNLGVAADA